MENGNSCVNTELRIYPSYDMKNSTVAYDGMSNVNKSDISAN